MGDNLVFVLSRENVPKSKCEIPLDIDIASQPDIVLIVNISEPELKFETTDKTVRILNK